VRREHQAMVRHVLESLTDEELAADVTRHRARLAPDGELPRQGMSPRRPQRGVAAPALCRA
jgi:hypothetical protein